MNFFFFWSVAFWLRDGCFMRFGRPQSFCLVKIVVEVVIFFILFFFSFFNGDKECVDVASWCLSFIDGRCGS